jgi:hypothetical protein
MVGLLNPQSRWWGRVQESTLNAGHSLPLLRGRERQELEGLFERTPPKCGVLLIEDDRLLAGNKADIDVEVNFIRFGWNDSCGFPVDSQRCEPRLFAELSDRRVVGALPGFDATLDEKPLSQERSCRSLEEQKLVGPGSIAEHDDRDPFPHRPAP